MSNSTQNDWEKKWAKLEKFIYYASAKDFPMDGRKRVCIDAVQAKIMVEELLADARREAYEKGYQDGFDRKPRQISDSAHEYQKKLATLREEEK